VNSGYPSGLCASDFELLIRAYWSPTAFDDWKDVGDYNARVALFDAGLLVHPSEVRNGHRLTDRGLAFVRFILELPLPQIRWEIPGYQSAKEAK
jgi:hypothetical protein